MKQGNSNSLITDLWIAMLCVALLCAQLLPFHSHNQYTAHSDSLTDGRDRAHASIFHLSLDSSHNDHHYSSSYETISPWSNMILSISNQLSLQDVTLLWFLLFLIVIQFFYRYRPPQNQLLPDQPIYLYAPPLRAPPA